MSSTSVQERPAKGPSSDSGRTIPSQFTQPAPDPSASKRLCFYKSGDYTFSGHRLVVNARTFKTFDALLDALSKKVPLPFGVRTVTTPRGTHLVKALDDLHDGGSYVCSDQKRVKPLNLEEVNRRQVPWNTTRPLRGSRRQRQALRFRQFGPIDETRSAKITERVAVRTPKRLLVIKNKDPTLRRTIVLQRRTAPTFDALLDYLSQILQFPVLKLYSTDGRRVDGLAALILCSGVLVAAGSEPFRLGSYTFSGLGQFAPAPHGENPVESSMLQPRVSKNKVLFNGRDSRNFSLSSERYIINQINKSQNGSLAGGNHQNQPKKNHQLSNHHTSMEAYNTERIDTGHHACIIPQDDDIEKSFRVNQDGSMTVEMKVHLTIKEEEVLHWTTTLSRSSTSKIRNCTSFSESEHNSPDVNNALDKASCSVSDAEAKEENCLGGGRKEVGFNGYSSGASGNTKNCFKRNPTPGPRHVNKKASVESVKMVSESGIQENTLGHYSYMETTVDGETTEGYCVVQHSSSSSSRPIPMPRKTASAGTRDKHSTSSIRSSGVAEVLQIQNNGMEVTETVMHIYESQGCYDNYFANEDYSVDSVPLDGSAPAPARQPASDSGPSSSNDCDIDCSWQPPTAGSQQRQKEEMLSLSSEPTPQTCEKTNNMSSQSPPQESLKKDNTPRRTKKKTIRSARNQKSSTSTSSTDLKQRENKANSSKNIKVSSFGKLGSDANVKKNGDNLSESTKRSKEEKKVEKIQSKKSIQDEKLLRKEPTLSVRSEPMKRTPSERRNLNIALVRENGNNVNTPSARPQMKKNMTEFFQTNKANTLGKKKTTKPKFLTETKTPTLRKPLELADSVSMPLLNPLDNPSPDEVHQYVENWLEQANPDPVPYTEGEDETESRNKVIFQIGGDTESDEKNGHQTNSDENHLSSGDAMKKSTSCLSVPLSHEGMSASLQNNERTIRGLCVSMPTFRVDPVHHENRLRSHQSAEAIGPENDESTSSNILSPKLKIKPVLKQLCSSIQCIRRATATDTTSNLEKSNSLPDFPTQVASVFGSSCKALFSFLSVMTLRDNLGEGNGSPSKTNSEAKLMMESLQKISTIDDEEEQRASLTDLQSRASSQFRERWKDFVTLRERLESEPLSPRFSETEFALDVMSEGGDAFEDQQLGINELMEELNMPPELRAEIAATIQQTKSFYPMEESTFIETEKNMSDSEEDVEQFVEESKSETILSEDHDSIDKDVTRITSDGDPIAMNHMMSVSDKEPDPCNTQTEEEEPIKEEEAEEEEEKVQEVYSDTNEIEGRAEADGRIEEDLMSHEEEEQDDNETGGESAEKMEEEVSEDEEGVGEEVEDEEETTGASIVEETDEREGAEETEEENEMEDEEEIIEGNDVGSDHFSEEEEEEEVTESADEKKDVANNLLEEKDDEEEEEEGEEVTESGDEKQDVANNLQEEKDDEEEEEEGEEVTESGDEKQDVANNLQEEQDDEEEEEEGEEVTESGDEKQDVANNLQEEQDDEEEEEEGEEVTESGDEKQDVANNLQEEQDDEEEEEEGEEVTESGDEKKDVANNLQEEKDDEEEEEEEVNVIEYTNKVEEDQAHLSVAEDVGKEDNEESDGGTHVPEEQEEEEEVQEVDEKTQNVDEEVIEVDEGEKVEEEDNAVSEEDNKSSVKKNRDEEHEEKEEERCDDSFCKGTTEAEEESTDDKEAADESEIEGNMTPEQPLEVDEVTENDEEELNKEETQLNEAEEDVDSPSNDNKEPSLQHVIRNFGEAQVESKSFSEEDIDRPPDSNEEQSLHPGIRNCEGTEVESKSCSSEDQCEDEKVNGIEVVNEEESDEGGGNTVHPVEISQDLLDFVNHALQSSSLLFTYDSQGNLRLEPDTERMLRNQKTAVSKNRQDSLYGSKCLPSPYTSDLSDYRPETSESRGYKSQESEDILSDSGEEPLVPAHSAHKTKQVTSRVLDFGNAGSLSSEDSGNKTLKEVLSLHSVASTSKTLEKESADGVLIDQGRWLLKENHLIRKSPPASLGMYANLDSISSDGSQENNGEDSPSYLKTQHSPLAALSSSELEEMARPQTPKCTYFNMPHGSDSDPFLDDCSVKSGKKHSRGVNGRNFKVSPVVDTSKTWANKNGSMSSFASVEFRISDRKVHPEGEPSAVSQVRRTSSGEESTLQSRDALNALRVRCGQYCPIL